MAAPQIKQDVNRSGWEKTDFPSVCERCLPDNPYVQMLKEDHGAECKICTRPFTVFRWKADRTSRTQRTSICLTCARLKNCCQSCMLDLSFGLPIVVRDAALKLVAPGPQSGINREYYAQEHERELDDGRGGLEEYEKTDEKARELLRRLAHSEPYYKGPRRSGPAGTGPNANHAPHEQRQTGLGPVRTRDGRGRGRAGGRAGMPGGHGPGRGGGGGGGGGGRTFPSTAQLPPGPHDVIPPEDVTITSLFLTGVEDDLPEHELRTFFSKFGPLRSIVCSHRSHCAFVNYQQRVDAESAAESSQGKAIVAGCPLRVQWGRPKPLDSMDRQPRLDARREGRAAVYGRGSRGGGHHDGHGIGGAHRGEFAQHLAQQQSTLENITAVAPPPGADDVRYASLAGS